MKKIGILIDSFSGFSKTQAKKHNLEFINLVVELDNQEYKDDGKDINLQRDFDKFVQAKTLKTSAPKIGEVLKIFKSMSKKYDQVIYLAISGKLSSTFASATKIAQEFNNIYVVDQLYFGHALLWLKDQINIIYQKHQSIDNIIDFVNKMNQNIQTTIIPSNIDAFIKGGRLSGVKKFIFEKVKLIPKIAFTNNGNKIVGISRNFIKAIKNVMEKSLKNAKGKVNDFYWQITYTGLKAKEYTENICKELNVKKYFINWASTIVAIHTGLNAVSITYWPKKIN